MEYTVKIEMNTLESTTNFWAWSNKSFTSVGEFAKEYNTQAKKFGESTICKQQVALLANGLQMPTEKWVFRVSEQK
jgi:hypothetical protein